MIVPAAMTRVRFDGGTGDVSWSLDFGTPPTVDESDVPGWDAFDPPHWKTNKFFKGHIPLGIVIRLTVVRWQGRLLPQLHVCTVTVGLRE